MSDTDEVATESAVIAEGEASSAAEDGAPAEHVAERCCEGRQPSPSPSPSPKRVQDRPPRGIAKAEQDELISSSLNIGLPVLLAWIVGYLGFTCLLAGLVAAVAIHNQYR